MTIFDSEFLENLKNAIVKCNINKSLILKLSNKTKNVESTQTSVNTSCNNSNNVDSFSNKEMNSSDDNLNIVPDIAKDIDALSNNTTDIEQFLYSIIPLIEKYIQNEKKLQGYSEGESNNSNTNKDIPSMEHAKKIENLVENTLIISETQGKVFLPYFITDLEEISKCNDNMPFDEIIEQKYTLPISNFKVLAISRFKEAFKLARTKEKKSFKFAFDLGLELLFNYNLHPAIIAACRTLDELDIYLDCLDSGETDKYECFNIKFEVPPILVKK